MKQPTPLEWLKEQLEEFGDTAHLSLTWETLDELFYEAKDMEKEQIVKVYNDGYKDGQSDPDSSKDISEFNNAELYYNETFEKK